MKEKYSSIFREVCKQVAYMAEIAAERARKEKNEADEKSAMATRDDLYAVEDKLVANNDTFSRTEIIRLAAATNVFQQLVKKKIDTLTALNEGLTDMGSELLGVLAEDEAGLTFNLEKIFAK